MLPVAAVDLDDAGLVTVGGGIRAGASESLGPVGGESLDMLRMSAMAECMADHVVSHHPTMPSAGKIAQTLDATRGRKHSLHASMMTIP